MEKEYCVYMHTFPNNKKYIGITRQNVERRWSNGKHYKTQAVGRAINKYGWNNIKHEILYSDLTENEAMKCEQKLISKYKTNQRDFGYNKSIGGETGRKVNYMCEGAVQFIHNTFLKAYNQYQKIFDWWKWICEDELESKVFNNAYHYVKKLTQQIKKRDNYLIEDYNEVLAINSYLEAWQNDWTIECAKDNALYALTHPEKITYKIIFENGNDDWKKKILIESKED